MQNTEYGILVLVRELAVELALLNDIIDSLFSILYSLFSILYSIPYSLLSFLVQSTSLSFFATAECPASPANYPNGFNYWEDSSARLLD